MVGLTHLCKISAERFVCFHIDGFCNHMSGKQHSFVLRYIIEVPALLWKASCRHNICHFHETKANTMFCRRICCSKHSSFLLETFSLNWGTASVASKPQIQEYRSEIPRETTTTSRRRINRGGNFQGFDVSSYRGIGVPFTKAKLSDRRRSALRRRKRVRQAYPYNLRSQLLLPNNTPPVRSNSSQKPKQIINAGTENACEIVQKLLQNPNVDDQDFKSFVAKCGTRVGSCLVEKVLGMLVNNWGAAYSFFIWAGKQPGYSHTTEVLNTMINILGKAKKFEEAWNSMQSNAAVVTTKTFGVLFKRYAAAHMVEEAVEAFHRMPDFNHAADINAFQSLINYLCEHNHVVEAEHLSIGCDPLFPPDTKVYNILLTGWCKKGAFQECKRFWKEANKLDTFNPDIFSYSIYMDTLVKAGHPKKALKAFEEMESRGIQPDVTVYNVLIHAMGETDLIKDSVKILQKMLHTGCRPNVMTYNTVIKNLCKLGKLRKAFDMMERMIDQQCFPNATTYHLLFQQVREPRRALRLLDKMVLSGCELTIDTHVMLMRMFGRWGLLRVVLRLWNHMQQRGCSPDKCAYEALIFALKKRRNFTLADKFNDEMIAKGFKQ